MIDFTVKRDQNLINTLVEQGLKSGKVLWCCCSYHENEARMILNYMHGIYEEETEAERIARCQIDAEADI